MKLTPFHLGVLPLTLLALLAPAPGAAVAAPGPPASRAGRDHSATDISRFLSFYGKHGPTDHDRRRHISQVLVERQEANPGHDVLLCAQNVPRDIAIGPVTVAQSAGVGWATVTTHWEDARSDTFTAYVRLDSQPIRLDDVICAG